ncbi:MAG: methionyl-tRNA formyltransferase [Bdellovibrionales bacterium]
MTALRIIFMGSPSFVVPVAEALRVSAHNLIGVYCRAPDNAGRGMKLRKVPVHEWADAHSVPAYTPLSLRKKEAQDELAALQPDLCVVAGYGMILPQAVLDIPTYGCINVHPSLLPRWRGATPVQRTIEAGDAETGVCIMQLDAGMDTGPLWDVQHGVKVEPTITAGALYDKLFEMGAAQLSSVIKSVVAGEKPTPQATEGVTHAGLIEKAEGAMNFNRTAAELERQTRAFKPWLDAWFSSNNQRIKVHAAAVGPATDKPARTLLPGNAVACGQGTSLILLTLQREGGKPQSADEFFRGFKANVGDVL